jgi:hypothetical protein
MEVVKSIVQVSHFQENLRYISLLESWDKSTVEVTNSRKQNFPILSQEGFAAYIQILLEDIEVE